MGLYTQQTKEYTTWLSTRVKLTDDDLKAISAKIEEVVSKRIECNKLGSIFHVYAFDLISRSYKKLEFTPTGDVAPGGVAIYHNNYACLRGTKNEIITKIKRYPVIITSNTSLIVGCTKDELMSRIDSNIPIDAENNPIEY